MKKLFAIVMLVSTFVACKPEPIEIKIKQADPKLVIHSQYVSEGLMIVSVTRSFPAKLTGNLIDSNGIHIDSSVFVDNAEVWIKGPGLELRLEWLESGIYGTEQAFLQNGVTYEISVNGAQLKASASAVKLEKIMFDSVSAKHGTLGISPGIDLYYAFTDNPAQENYYVVNYLAKKDQERIPEKPDADYIAKRLLQQNVSFDLLSDKDFKNNRYFGSKRFNNYQGDTLVIGLSNISKGYFTFLEAQKRAGTLFNQLNAEVINFPTNIREGYGYYNLHEPDIRVLELN